MNIVFHIQGTKPAFQNFLSNESGAITVDWTVISCAAVSLALGTAALFTDVNGMLATNMNEELADGDLSDGYPDFAAAEGDGDWPDYAADGFDPLLTAGTITVTEAQALYDDAHDMMNHGIITALEAGIAAMEAGTLTIEELNELVSIATVAYERNLGSDAELDYYFGFEGSEPFYVTAGSQSVATN
jgi:Flp pilus assembly pilin Flp